MTWFCATADLRFPRVTRAQRPRFGAWWPIYFATPASRASPHAWTNRAIAHCSHRVAAIRCRTTERGKYALIGNPDVRRRRLHGTAPLRVHRRAADLGLRATGGLARNRVRRERPALEYRNESTAPLVRENCARTAVLSRGVTFTGSHLASAERVARGRGGQLRRSTAVTYAFLSELYPRLTQQLRIIARTDWSPAIPSSRRTTAISDVSMRCAAHCNGSQTTRAIAKCLALSTSGGILGLGERTTGCLRTYEQDARAARYPVLC